MVSIALGYAKRRIRTRGIPHKNLRGGRKSVSPKTAKHAFEPRRRCGAVVAWSHWRARRHLGSYLLGRCLNLNSNDGVLQDRTLTVEVCFVNWTLAKLVRLHGTRAIVDVAPVLKSIYL